MSFAIAGMGTALPPATISQDDAAVIAQNLCGRGVKQANLLPTLYRRTGIAQRHFAVPQHVVDDVHDGTRHSGSEFLPSGAADDHGPTTAQRMQRYAEWSPPLALQACHRALDQARLPPRSLTHLITVSCTGFRAPGVDIHLIKRLKLVPTIQRTHIGFMGCHGALNGLRVAQAFTGADPDARVLLCAVELCSLHLHYGWDAERMVGNALFADGAAALVGTSESALPDAWRIIATGSCLLPDSEAAMGWTIGDHGFDMILSAQVPHVIGKQLRPWLESWLEQHGTSLERIASWAVHPGGPRVLAAQVVKDEQHRRRGHVAARGKYLARSRSGVRRQA